MGKQLVANMVEVSPDLARQYVKSQYPELRQAGKLMLEWIEKQKNVSWQPINLEQLEGA